MTLSGAPASQCVGTRPWAWGTQAACEQSAVGWVLQATPGTWPSTEAGQWPLCSSQQSRARSWELSGWPCAGLTPTCSSGDRTLAPGHRPCHLRESRKG